MGMLRDGVGWGRNEMDEKMRVTSRGGVILSLENASITGLLMAPSCVIQQAYIAITVRNV